MRCPSCGTENEPDSRFCGGCGAKLVVESRVAPTAKISDDARYPTPVPGVAPSIAPGGHAPAQSLPPRLPAPAMVTPPPGSLRGMQANPAASAPEMSESLPIVKKRPVALMVVLLIVDLALAAAGAVMLAKGLAKKDDARPVATTPAPAQTMNATGSGTGSAAAPVATVAATAPAAASASITTAAEPAKDAAKDPPADPPKSAAKPVTKPETKTDTKPDAKRSPTKKTGTSAASGGGGALPEDPYAPDLGAEIEQNAASSADQFQHCYDNAASVAPVHGLIQIAYQVLPGGTVAHVAAVQNTTDSAWLAACLGGAIAAWRFSPHAGKTLEFVRPFSYP